MVYRGLDGSVSDYPIDESIIALQRSPWMQDALRARFGDNAAHRPGAADAGIGTADIDLGVSDGDRVDDDVERALPRQNATRRGSHSDPSSGGSLLDSADCLDNAMDNAVRGLACFTLVLGLPLLLVYVAF